MQVTQDLNRGQRYRVFAHVGNGLSSDGVSVSVDLLGTDSSFTFEFWTRQDAVTFFRHMASAAEETTTTEDDAIDISGAALAAEDATMDWADIEAGKDG